MNAPVFHLLWNHHHLCSNIHINISSSESCTEMLQWSGQTPAKKKCVFLPEAAHVSAAPKQSSDSSFLCRHMAFGVILGHSTDRNDTREGRSASPSVWNARLFPLKSNIIRHKTRLHKRQHSQWLTLYDWSATKFPVLSGLGWTLVPSVWISEEGK